MIRSCLHGIAWHAPCPAVHGHHASHQPEEVISLIAWPSRGTGNSLLCDNSRSLDSLHSRVRVIFFQFVSVCTSVALKQMYPWQQINSYYTVQQQCPSPPTRPVWNPSVLSICASTLNRSILTILLTDQTLLTLHPNACFYVSVIYHLQARTKHNRDQPKACLCAGSLQTGRESKIRSIHLSHMNIYAINRLG